MCYTLISIYRKILLEANCPDAKSHNSILIIKKLKKLQYLVLITVSRLISPVLSKPNVFPKETVVQVCHVQCAVLSHSVVSVCHPIDCIRPGSSIQGQALLSMGFFRQGYWSRLPFPSLGDLPNPGIEPTSHASPALVGRFLTTGATWEAPGLAMCFLPEISSPLIKQQHLAKWLRPRPRRK